MKVRNTLIWLFFSVFFMQQASVTVASSFHNNEQSNVSTEMSCDHHMMHQSDIDGMNCSSSDVHDKSCCKTDCHCNASGCTSASSLLVGSSIQNRLSRSVHSFSSYALVFPDMHASSLFRPPIFS